MGYEALLIVLDPTRLMWLGLGAMVGLVVGMIPGLGGTVGMAILLPFIFGMDPFTGMALLIGMTAVTHTGDTFPSVLLGVPGSSGSQATIMDGYPLAQKGEAGRALGAAFTVSAVGGLIGAFVLFGIVSVARPLILALGQPELFMFAMLGLSMVGVLARGSATAGVASGVFGLLLGLIGIAPATPAFRYTFDTLYLYDGIPLAVLALGLFALPEMIDLVAANRSISQTAQLGGGRIDGMRDAWRHKFLVLRSSVLGTTIGMVPGLGGAVVDWIAYGITKQTSSNSQNFGKGDIRGVIGPESANNAKEGGTLIPTLLFGIPGSGSTAILLGGLVMFGLQPGPPMVSENLDVTLAIVWTLALANLIGTAACLTLSSQISKISLVPARLLVPFLLVVMMIAGYQSTRHWGDIIVFLGLGLVGWIMKNVGWPRAPMLIGFVLAISAERYLHLSISLHGYGWLTNPIVLVLATIIILLIFGGQVHKLRRTTAAARKRQEQRDNDGDGEAKGRATIQRPQSMPLAARARFVFTSLVLVTFLWSAWAATDFPQLARYMPLYASLAGALLCAMTLAGDLIKWRRVGNVIGDDIMETATLYGAEKTTTKEPKSAPENDTQPKSAQGTKTDAPTAVDGSQAALLKRAGAMIAWIFGYACAIFVFGFILGTTVFLVAFLRIMARTGWVFTAAATVISLIGVNVAQRLLELRWPTYLLDSMY